MVLTLESVRTSAMSELMSRCDRRSSAKLMGRNIHDYNKRRSLYYFVMVISQNTIRGETVLDGACLH